MILWLLLCGSYRLLYIVLILCFSFHLHLSPPLFCSSVLLLSPSFLFYVSLSLQATLLAKVRWVSTGFHSQNCPLPKRCLLMIENYESRQETHFTDVSRFVWIGSYFSNTHKHRQAHTFMCLHPNV